jgi:DNA-directed RNA polymerase subunit RPC12/RpoP
MSDFVTLTCPSCGGKLQITKDIDRFACGHCGSEHVVKRAGGIVALAPVVEGLAKVQAGTDKTAAELAIVRLTQEIAALEIKKQKLVSRIAEQSTSIFLFSLVLAASVYGALTIANWGAMTWFVPVAIIVFGLLAPGATSGGDRSAIATLNQEIANKEQELENHRQQVSTK